MEFRNPTEFARFLSSHELTRLDRSFLQMVNCINSYSSACNCHNRETKIQLYQSCNKLYQDLALHLVNKFKNEFLSKITDRQISFYTEQGQLISIVSR